MWFAAVMASDIIAEGDDAKLIKKFICDDGSYEQPQRKWAEVYRTLRPPGGEGGRKHQCETGTGKETAKGVAQSQMNGEDVRALKQTRPSHHRNSM